VSGHDARRADVIRARTRNAVDELRRLRSSDPAAADALDAIRLTVHTLEQWWLPELSRLAADAAIGDR
jgi:hypothetical protein